MNTYHVFTASGQFRDIPEHLVDEVVGLDAEGRIVVDQFGVLDLAEPESNDCLFALTLCCNASDKGLADGVVCRGCFRDDDTGAYLSFDETTGTFPGLDPISGENPHVVVVVDEAWALIGDYEAAARYASGIPMWASREAATRVTESLNDRRPVLTEES